MFVEKVKTYNIIPLTEVKEHLGIFQDDNDFNNELNAKIRVAISHAEKICGIDIAPTLNTLEDYYLASGYFDIVQSPISNISFSGFTEPPREVKAVKVTGYTIQKYYQFTRLKFFNFQNFDKIIVKYDSGFQVLPTDLKHAIIMIVAQLFDVDKTGYSASNLAETKAIQRLLSHYKNYIEN